MSEIIIIAAVAKNGIIGRNGKIPWHIKEDFQHFKKLTLGYSIIMGRKTWESLPVKPLKDRMNIILTRQEDFKPEGAIVKSSLKDALDCCNSQDKVFIIGGESVYKEALPIANTLELTKIDKDYIGDTYFPDFDSREWKLEKKEDKKGYSFLSYARG